MLRASAQTVGVELDLRAVGDRGVDPGDRQAAALLAFTDALVGRERHRLGDVRGALRELMGDLAVAQAASVAGNFEMMNRIVDATGIPVPAPMAAIAPEIGLTEPTSPPPSPPPSRPSS